MKKKYLPYLYTTVIYAAVLLMLANKQRGVGRMSDAPVALEKLKQGIANGWYQAQLTTVGCKPAVRLSGKLINGKPYSDVYPITAEVQAELKQMGIPTV